MKNNRLITKKDIKNIAALIDEEIKSDYQNKIKSILIKKKKQIRMMEITLEKAKKEFDDILNGDKVITEEDYLFG